METILHNLESLEKSLARENAIVRELRKKRQAELDKLYKFMTEQHIEDYKGFNREALAPRPKISAKEKQGKIIKAMEEKGVEDPLVVLEEIKKIQRPARRPVRGKVASKKTSKKKKKKSAKKY